MAERVPDPGLPDVQPHALPTPQMSEDIVTPDVAGAGTARTLQRLTGVAKQLADQTREDANTTAITAAGRRAKQALNQYILDPETGYASQRGADAMASRDKYVSEFGKALDGISGDLTPEQRLHFDQQANTLREQAAYHVYSHETHEQNQYALGQYRGNVDQTMVTMQNPAVISNPALLKKQIDELWDAGIDEARRRFGQNAGQGAIASVVIPELQKAAAGTMQQAIGISEATQNPLIAKQAMDVLGRYLITDHHRDFAKAVEALSAKTTIAATVGKLVQDATTTVMVPGGPPVPQLDPVKFAAGLNALPPDTQYLEAITKTARQSEDAHGKLWTAAAGSVADRVHSAGYDLTTGVFDIDSPRIAAADKVFLMQHATGEWDKLRALDARVQRANSKDVQDASKAALSDLKLSLWDPENRDTYLRMSAADFNARARELQMLPGALTDAAREYRRFVDAANKPVEPVGTTVARVVKAAIPGEDPETRDERTRLFEPVLNAATQFREHWKETTGGKAPKLEELQKFIEAEVAKGKVGGTGFFGSDVGRDVVRRIDYETRAAYQGKPFTVTDETAPAIPLPVRAATPAAAPSARVTVRNPAGKEFTLPPEQVDKFLASPEGKGFTR